MRTYENPPLFMAEIKTQVHNMEKKLMIISHVKMVALFVGAFLFLIMACTVAGMTTAVAGSFFYIALLFPLAMGFAGGNILTVAMQMAKIRKTYLMILMSLLGAVLIYGAYHYGRYVSLQVQMSIEIFPSLDEATEDENLDAAKTFLDFTLREQTGRSGFTGYMLFKAQEGVSIGRFYRQNRLQLGSALTWLYWALELGIVLWIMLIMGKKQAGIPVCEACGRQYPSEKHLGGTMPANEWLLLTFLQRKDFPGLGNLLEKNADLPSTELYIQACEACTEGSSHLTVRRASRSAHGTLSFTDVSKIILEPGEARAFLQQSQLDVN